MRLEKQLPANKEKDYSIYPFRNFSLDSMDGEHWKDIPGLDGLFSVSNYGRIWAASRHIVSITGQTYHTKERIRKQNMTKVFSPYCEDPLEQLNIKLRYERKEYSFKVSRLVYDLFVERLDSHNENLLVVHKDGDNCNNRYDNLILMNGTELYGHRLSLNRIPRTGQVFRKNEALLSGTNRARRIIQYSLGGEKLNEYENLAQAARENKIDRMSLRLVAQQKRVQLHGLVYRFGDTPYHGEHAGFSNEKKINQYTLEGKKVGSYPSIKEAARKTYGDASAISKCALKKIKTYRNFVWCYEGDEYDGSYKNTIKNRPLHIVQFHLDGKKLANFKSANEACRLTGFNAGTILDCAHKRSKVAHGFVWRFEGDSYSGEYKGYQKGRPVTQFTLEGKKIKSYATIAAAGLATGLTADNIEKNVNGHNKTAGGFVWKFASPQEAARIRFVPAERENIGKRREIVRYSSDGKKQKEFASISEASKACRVSAQGISVALDKPGRTAAGFVWRTKGNKYDASDKIVHANKARIVTQYSLDGTKISVYASTWEANKITGIPSASISGVARGKHKSTGGFIWIYGNGPMQIDVQQHYGSVEEHMISISKPVLKFSLDGEFIKEYPSIQAAGRGEGIRTTTISSAINGQTKSAGGNLWKLKENVSPGPE